MSLLHKSFRDFLLLPGGIGIDDFQVNIQEIHAMLASMCFNRMKSDNGLRRDICNVQKPGKLRNEIDEATIARHIPPDLQYSYLYRVYHLQHSERQIMDEEGVVFSSARTSFTGLTVCLSCASFQMEYNRSENLLADVLCCGGIDRSHGLSVGAGLDAQFLSRQIPCYLDTCYSRNT